MFFVFWVLLVLGAILLMLSLSPSGKKGPQKPIKGTNFIPSHMFMSNDGHCGLAVNDQSLRLCLLKNPEIPPQLLPISGLVGSFLVKNGEFLVKRLRTGPKALISFQTIMHSNVERLISSWRTTASPHDNQRIDLIVLTHNESDPLHVVNFLDMETKEGGILYEKALSTATHWHAMMNDLILHADQQARLQAEPDQDETESPLVPVTDELEKLGDLVEKKFMTPQEFIIQKEKLLAAKI